ncbi:MAG: type II secretion system protein GspD [Saprospiraceae bacterium]
MKKILLSFSILLLCLQGMAQPNDPRFDLLARKLDDYAMENRRINKLIDISITGTLQEFAISFSKETKLNLTIDPSINKNIVTNFSDTKPRDILLHLCKFYQLDLSFSGSIISLIPYEAPPVQIAAYEVDIEYNKFNDGLEMNLRNDTLDQVVKKISQLTDKNVISSKAASNTIVNGFIGKTNLENALSQFAQRNDLSLTKDAKGYFFLDLEQNQAKSTNAGGANASRKKRGRGQNNTKRNTTASNPDFTLTTRIDSLNQTLINLDASDVSISDLLKAVSSKTENNFFLFTEPTEKISLKLEEATYENFLTKVLQGSKYTFKKDNNIFLIGDRNLEGLRETAVIQLQYISAKEFDKSIPKDIKENLEIIEYIGLNSLVMSGSAARITEVKTFIEKLDRPIPVVNIELLIVDVQQNNEIRMGLEAGVGQEPVTPGGQVFGGLDFTFSSGAINQLLNTLAGNGIVNLGQVNPNFYATLQAVEDNGTVNVRSKPRLSTLNGEEAELSIGETRYYLNERTTLQGNQNPVTLQDRRYESVNADFSIKILPVVSGDEHVTLEIEVKQSDFTGQISPDAPPGQVNRNFNSNIRMVNGEMIVLGGLESKSVEDSGSGVPFLARIPVIKWFFSKRRRAKTKSKLLIFVKPTIVY